MIKTSVFDRVARDGALFTQACCASPSCTPSPSAILKRSREELYDCREDPHQLHNLALDPAYRATLRKLSDRPTAQSKASGDPRETTGETPWDAWPYYGNNRWKILPEQANDADEN